MRSPHPEFPREEYERRLAAVQRLMADDSLDALLVVDEPNYRYLTGHFTESWLNRSRPCACWVPSVGEPVPVLCETDEAWARATSWCSTFAAYGGPVLGPRALGAPEVGFEPAVAQTLVAAARDMRLPRASRIGMPMGSRSRVQLPLGVVLQLREALTDAAWVDAAGLMWDVRSVKCELELEYVRAAVAALDHAMPRAVASARPGMTELQLAQLQRSELFAGGAHHVGYTNVVSDLTGPLFSAPSDRAIVPGHVFYIDGGAVVHGYWSDYCRLGVVGEPSHEAKRGYALLVEALEAGVAATSEGVLAADVARAMTSVLDGRGATGAAIGRMGHANGLEMPEPPSIHPDDRTRLRAGMVLSLEPNLTIGDVGTLVVEDVVVVTAHGCENLSRTPTPRTLPRVELRSPKNVDSRASLATGQ